MSQRQLALQSGVDHSTISRLIKGDRMPSLGTATKLARGLREIPDDGEGPAYFASMSRSQMLPTSRVEYALRGDEALTVLTVIVLGGILYAFSHKIRRAHAIGAPT